MKEYQRAGLVARFKPLHNGAASMLEAVCEQSEEVIIGIGSTNKYNLRNPFTVKETEEMIDAYLSPRFSNYSFVHIPDFAQDPKYADGQKWRGHVNETFGEIDAFVSTNTYINDLLKDDYNIVISGSIIAPENRVRLRASEVRAAMAKGEDWQQFVPKEVANYISDNKLDERFRKEFGLQALAELPGANYHRLETLSEEHQHAMEAC